MARISEVKGMVDESLEKDERPQPISPSQPNDTTNGWGFTLEEGGGRRYGVTCAFRDLGQTPYMELIPYQRNTHKVVPIKYWERVGGSRSDAPEQRYFELQPDKEEWMMAGWYKAPGQLGEYPWQKLEPIDKQLNNEGTSLILVFGLGAATKDKFTLQATINAL